VPVLERMTEPLGGVARCVLRYVTLARSLYPTSASSKISRTVRVMRTKSSRAGRCLTRVDVFGRLNREKLVRRQEVEPGERAGLAGGGRSSSTPPAAPRGRCETLLDIARRRLGRYSDCLQKLRLTARLDRTDSPSSIELIERLGGEAAHGSHSGGKSTARRFAVELDRLERSIALSDGLATRSSRHRPVSRCGRPLDSRGVAVDPQRVNLLTLHSTRPGVLEGGRVGAEDRLLPGIMKWKQPDRGIEEARRLHMWE